MRSFISRETAILLRFTAGAAKHILWRGEKINGDSGTSDKGLSEERTPLYKGHLILPHTNTLVYKLPSKGGL